MKKYLTFYGLSIILFCMKRALQNQYQLNLFENMEGQGLTSGNARKPCLLIKKHQYWKGGYYGKSNNLKSRNSKRVRH